MTKEPRWVKPPLATRITAHVSAWEAARKTRPSAAAETYPFITISREYGCQGAVLGYRLAEVLNERLQPTVPWAAYDRELLDRVAGELNLTRGILESVDEQRRDEMVELFDAIINKRVEDAVVFRKMAEVVRSLAIQGQVVLVGRGAYLITQDLKTGLHVRLMAPLGWRVERYARDYGIPREQAEKAVVEGQRQREKFLQTFFVHDPRRGVYHDLVFDNSRFDVDQLTEVVLAAIRARYPQRL